MNNRSACVFDTNCLISALLIKSSISRAAFDKAIDHYQILISDETIAEFDEVAGRSKFEKYISKAEREIFKELLIDVAERMKITEHIQASRDRDDDKFLALAVTGGANVIISGDDDLLTLNPFRGIRIVPPRVFVEEIDP